MHFVEAPNNFYIGAQVNPETGEVIRDAPVYLEARALTTHAVILGMTGSGKTGLGVTILEEAALDNIPAIIIDVKGDISNMLLAFPELTPAQLQPWVNPEDAARAGRSIEEHAQRVSQEWRQGLTRWGINAKRLQKYQRASNFTIYTPGSEAGLPINILQSFAAPREGWLQNEERLREHIVGTVTALLDLVGINAQPLKDREHLLLSNIFEYNWRNGRDLTLNELILQVQRPPFDKMGVFDVETIFPEKDRFKLAQQLNNIIAAPGFQAWMKGEPLHIPSLLYTNEGQSRTSIFYLAHLNDSERNFIITLITQSIIAWMRSLSGSTSLRALVYVDEVFGMFPPHPYNPPTKEPLLRLLKQGRGFGIGMILATQNPVDIDYKGLSNAGTWFIGKMQTDNDRKRVLEGISNAQDATSTLDPSQIDELIGELRQRQFIYHSIHEEETPQLIQTRWVMSYLRGPLTRSQVSDLMAGQRSQQPAPAQERPRYLASQSREAMQTYDAAAPAARQSIPAQAEIAVPDAQSAPTHTVSPGFSPMPPELPTGVQQYFLPVQRTVEQAVSEWEQTAQRPASSVQTRRRLLYRPALLAEAQLRFSHSKSNSSEVLWYAFVLPNLPKVPYVEWSAYQTDPFDPRALEIEPFARAHYGDLPQTLMSAPAFRDLQNSLRDWLYHNAVLTVYYNPTLKLYSTLSDDRRAFIARVQNAAREAREVEIEAITEKYDKQLEVLEEKARVKAMKLDSQRENLEARKREELLTGAESVWRLMKGNAYRTISRAGELRRFVGKDEDRVDIMQEELLDLADRLDALEQEMTDKLYAIQDKWANAAREVEEIPVTSLKKDITFIVFGIGWVPYWDVELDGAPAILPASTSGLSEAQAQVLPGSATDEQPLSPAVLPPQPPVP
jgi:hypothetical protein